MTFIKTMENIWKTLGLILGACATLSFTQVVHASDVNKAIQEAHEKGTLRNVSEWQNTPSFARPNGAIETTIFSQSDIEKLSKTVSQADAFHGNVFYGKVATEHVLVQPGHSDDQPIRTFLGTDGILQIANRSSYLTDDIVQSAVDYWNTLAGATIMAFVSDTANSDEVIHDLPKNPLYPNTLMAQDYNGQGMICYPENFDQGSYTTEEFNNQKAALLIHELVHALGVSHMGGGDSGDHAGQSDGNGGILYWSEDFMSTWAPRHNPEGVTSTPIDAAALAIVGMAWEKPRQVAAWALKQDNSSLTMYDYKIVSEKNTIPYGLSVNDPANLMTEEVISKTITKNYNVYDASTVDNSFADREKYGHVNFIGTSQGLGLIGTPLYVTKDFTAHNGIHIYRGKTMDNKDYIINASAFGISDGPVDLPDWGVQVDGQIIQDTDQHYETVRQNYLVFEEILNVPELMAKKQYHYLNRPFSTTQNMGLVGTTTLVLKSYIAEDGVGINKVLIEGKTYYILKKAFAPQEIEEALAFSQRN